MEKCFVIQPFDNGQFDQRFADTFSPAIKKANLEAYRIDKDAGVRVPIEEIEKNIESCSMCFAEITTDNPNVWYELGYAFACHKDVIMVCSDTRKKFPFDIQHKKVITYSTKSKSDYERLENEITKTILAYQKSSTPTYNLPTMPIQKREDLDNYEIALLTILIGNTASNDSTISFYVLQEEMGKLGYNALATSVSIRTLHRRKMLAISKETDYNNELYDVCNITDDGVNWILAHRDNLNFKKAYANENQPPNKYMSNSLPF
jgi:hypothetical protein